MVVEEVWQTVQLATMLRSLPQTDENMSVTVANKAKRRKISRACVWGVGELPLQKFDGRGQVNGAFFRRTTNFNAGSQCCLPSAICHRGSRPRPGISKPAGRAVAASPHSREVLPVPSPPRETFFPCQFRTNCIVKHKNSRGNKTG